MNEIDYVDLKIDCMYITKILLRYQRIFYVLQNKYEINELIYILERYLKSRENIAFLSNFPYEKEKLLETLQKMIFQVRRILLQDDIDEIEEEIVDIQTDKILSLMKTISTIKNNDNLLKAYRNVNDDNIITYYKYDLDVALYLNDKDYQLKVNSNNYQYIMASIIYYIRTVIFTKNERLAVTRIKKLLSMPYESIHKKEINKYLKRKRSLNFELIEIGLSKSKNNIINIKKYIKKRI